MRFLITGGTGFLGSALARKLCNHGHHVTILSRQSKVPAYMADLEISLIDDILRLRKKDYFDIVVNLAGEGIADRPWSPARKTLLRTSRIATTEELLRALQRLDKPPRILLSGSAIGIYGFRTDGVVDEQTSLVMNTQDFAQQLCMEWEHAAQAHAHPDTRVILLRTGLVLGPGGLLARLLPLFRFGLGGRLGNGQQMMSWVHRDDWVGMVLQLIQDDGSQGPYNLTSPVPITNAHFTKVLSSRLHRPALLNVPASLLHLTLGDMSQLMLGSQNVQPTRLMGLGYNMRYPQIELAVSQILSRAEVNQRT